MTERFNLRAGTIIHTVRANAHGAEMWPVEPPFTVPEDGNYRAILNTSNGTASMERVHLDTTIHPPRDSSDVDQWCPSCGQRMPGPRREDRWAAFTNDELTTLGDAMTYTAVGSDTPPDDIADAIEAELNRRRA